jgi:hypothetical protein
MVYFRQEYFREEWRGYGASVAEVFFKLKGKDRSVPYVGFSVANSIWKAEVRLGGITNTIFLYYFP